MLNEMRDFYKALCRTLTGTKFKLISISKKCSAKLCCSYDDDTKGDSIYFEVTIKQGNIVSSYLRNKNDNIETLDLKTKEDGNNFEVYFITTPKIDLTVKTEVDFGTVSSFTVTATETETEISTGCKIYTMTAGNNMGKNIVGLDFDDSQKIPTDNTKYQGIDLRKYIHHTIEKDYPYDGTYKDIKTQEVSE